MFQERSENGTVKTITSMNVVLAKKLRSLAPKNYYLLRRENKRLLVRLESR